MTIENLIYRICLFVKACWYGILASTSAVHLLQWHIILIFVQTLWNAWVFHSMIIQYKQKHFHFGNNELPKCCFVSVVFYVLPCSVSCSCVYLGSVWKSSQLAGEATADTTESHLTSRLAPAGGCGRNRHSRCLPSHSADIMGMYNGRVQVMNM